MLPDFRKIVTLEGSHAQTVCAAGSVSEEEYGALMERY